MEAAVGQMSVGLHMAAGAPQAVLGVAAVLSVLCLEVPHRVAGVRIADLGLKKCAKSCAVVMWRCAPEVLGVSVVLFLALMLRLRGDTEVMANAQEQAVWEQIKVEWPVLMGADTLLNLQAMLRLLVLCFVAIRAEWGGRSPLTGMPALLFLAAMISRNQLNTQSDVYRLEGPLSLGGDLPIACELAAVPFLAALGLKGLKRAPVKAVLAVSGGIWFASHHFLNLAKNPELDRLFLRAHVLETMAAFAYVARAVSLMFCRDEGKDADGASGSEGRKLVAKDEWTSNAFVGFMHMIFVMQQAMSAYYFLTAFEPSASLIGGGRPFCVLCIGNLLQLGAFVCAAAVWAGASVDLNLPVEAILNVVELNDVETEAAATELPDSTPCSGASPGGGAEPAKVDVKPNETEQDGQESCSTEVDAASESSQD